MALIKLFISHKLQQKNARCATRCRIFPSRRGLLTTSRGCALNYILFSMVSARLLRSSNPSLSAKSNNECCEASVVWLKLFLCVWLSSSLVTTHTHEKRMLRRSLATSLLVRLQGPPRRAEGKGVAEQSAGLRSSQSLANAPFAESTSYILPKPIHRTMVKL